MAPPHLKIKTKSTQIPAWAKTKFTPLIEESPEFRMDGEASLITDAISSYLASLP
jgi:hypothetical protein